MDGLTGTRREVDSDKIKDGNIILYWYRLTFRNTYSKIGLSKKKRGKYEVYDEEEVPVWKVLQHGLWTV